MLAQRWLKGVKCEPLQKHDREVLCLDIRGNDLVTGSCDHAAHIYDLTKKTLRRRLFTKQYGHHEWVSCVSYAYDGRIVTGGMDSVICVWDKGSPKCVDCVDHQATISQVIADPEGPAFMSSSYDHTLKIWDLNSHSCIRTLEGHTGAVNDFVWKRSLAISIGRDGLMVAWDINSGKKISTVKHSSHVSTVCLLEHVGLVATGTQDGSVCIYDLRNFKAVSSIVAHPRAVSASLTCYGGISPSLISGGSDKNVVVLDAVMKWKQRAVLSGHIAPVQSVYCPSAPVPGLVVSGAANGWVTVHDANEAVGNTPALYACGALKGGIRGIKSTDDGRFLCVVGDDQEPVIFDFNQ